jgi:hypothetical protein
LDGYLASDVALAGGDSGRLPDRGYIADLVVDGVDSVGAALAAGLIAGAIIGGAEWFALRRWISWLNLVERWFAELTNRKLRRSAHRSITELEADIRAWINHWNADPKPFVWTKTADQILDTLAAYCMRINDSQH